MSAEVIQLFHMVDRKKLETHLALQCAPVLAGIKPSNLFITETSMEYMVGLFEGTSFSILLLYSSETRNIYLIYQKESLLEYLLESETMACMKKFGYTMDSLDHVLELFIQRYTMYMDKLLEFPHEMGLILGYPVEDVNGFIDHEGKDYLISGYWKVYANEAKTKALFELYDQVKAGYLKKIHQGYSLMKLLQTKKWSQDQIKAIAI